MIIELLLSLVFLPEDHFSIHLFDTSVFVFILKWQAHVCYSGFSTNKYFLKKIGEPDQVDVSKVFPLLSTRRCWFFKLFDAIINFRLVVYRQKYIPPINNRYMHIGGFKPVHKCFTRVQPKEMMTLKQSREEERGWHARKALMGH